MLGRLGRAMAPALLATVVAATACGAGQGSRASDEVTVRASAGGDVGADVAVVNHRLAALGLAKARATVRAGALVVSGTGSADRATVRRLVTDPGRLSFRPVERTLPLPCTPGPSVFTEEGDKACYQLGAGIDGGIARAAAEFDQNTSEWSVRIDFTDAGGAAFKDLAAQQTGRQVAIVVDETVVSAPVVQPSLLTNFNNTAQVTGSFAEADAKHLAAVLSAGPLPVPLTP